MLNDSFRIKKLPKLEIIKKEDIAIGKATFSLNFDKIYIQSKKPHAYNKNPNIILGFPIIKGRLNLVLDNPSFKSINPVPLKIAYNRKSNIL